MLNHLLTSHSELVQHNVEEKKYLKFFCVIKVKYNFLLSFSSFKIKKLFSSFLCKSLFSLISNILNSLTHSAIDFAIFSQLIFLLWPFAFDSSPHLKLSFDLEPIAPRTYTIESIYILNINKHIHFKGHFLPDSTIVLILKDNLAQVKVHQ